MIIILKKITLVISFRNSLLIFKMKILLSYTTTRGLLCHNCRRSIVPILNCEIVFLKAILYLAGSTWHSFKLPLIVWCFGSGSSPILRADIHIHLQRTLTEHKTYHNQAFCSNFPLTERKKGQLKAEINFRKFVFCWV